MSVRSWFTIVAAALASLVFAGQAGAAQPAQFRVGVAAVQIDPHEPVCLGGYGCGKPTDQLHQGEHLYARAIFIENSAGKAIAFAKVDSQGYFAAYQEGPYGISDIRNQVSGQWRRAGLKVSDANIVVSSTHSHSAPTIMGIWGPTNVGYLREVHDGVVRALEQARSSARAATLTWGQADAGFIDNVILGEANSNEGWPVDGAMPVLWARDAHTGATIATYLNVPVHANIVYGPGANLISADYPGVAERWLEARLGGTALVAMGTLGDQTSTMQVSNPGWTEIRHVGTLVGNLAVEALAAGHPITDSRLAAGQRYVTLPVTNPVLLSLIDFHGQLGQQLLGANAADRSDKPPYFIGADIVGTDVTAFRIGNLAYISEPGEAFPQVHSAIASSVVGADRVFVVGMAQDQLGYYFPAWAYPGTYYYSADHYLYNVSPAMADQVVEASLSALRHAGFDAAPASPLAPGAYDYARTTQPGVQDMAFPRSGAAPFTTEVQCFTDPARLQSNVQHPGAGLPSPDVLHVLHTEVGPCSLDFGDGSAPFSGTYPAQAVHTWTRPGNYAVTTQARDGNGNAVTWSTPVYVRPALAARGSARRMRGGQTLFSASVAGGDGSLLGAHWTFPDGTTAWGTQVVHRLRRGARVTVTVTDGDGDGATTTVRG